MSISTEDFLKGIYQLQFDLKLKASSSNLAERLSISQAAITDMARKLSRKGLIIYRKYKEINLTPEGKKIALRVIRKHRLWELFLARVLNIPIFELHHEAELLEHQTSEYLMNKIDDYLGQPAFDPHGDPIPDSMGQMPPTNNILLTEAKPGEKHTIVRLLITGEDVIQFLNSNGIHIGQTVLVDQIFESSQTMVLRIEDKQYSVNTSISNNIYVTANH